MSYNPIMVWILYSPLHGMLSKFMMVLNYTGRKSGKHYQLPVGYKKTDGTLLTVSLKKRTWWRNMRGGAPVLVHLQGRDIPAIAEVVEDDKQVEQGLRDFIGGNPRDARMFGIKVETDGSLNLESLNRAVKERVIVRTILQ